MVTHWLTYKLRIKLYRSHFKVCIHVTGQCYRHLHVVLQEQLQTKGKEIEEGEGGGDNGEGKNDSINIRLITLEEEKKILQEQLTITEENGRREMEDMKSEINRLEEKTKRKQEMLVRERGGGEVL